LVADVYNEASYVSTIQPAEITFEDGESLEVLVAGTETGMVFRIWANPTAGTLTNAETWDGGSADMVFTNNPPMEANS
jgi:hypothetical protein